MSVDNLREKLIDEAQVVYDSVLADLEREFGKDKMIGVDHYAIANLANITVQLRDMDARDYVPMLINKRGDYVANPLCMVHKNLRMSWNQAVKALGLEVGPRNRVKKTISGNDKHDLAGDTLADLSS